MNLLMINKLLSITVYCLYDAEKTVMSFDAETTVFDALSRHPIVSESQRQVVDDSRSNSSVVISTL